MLLFSGTSTGWRNGSTASSWNSKKRNVKPCLWVETASCNARGWSPSGWKAVFQIWGLVNIRSNMSQKCSFALGSTLSFIKRSIVSRWGDPATGEAATEVLHASAGHGDAAASVSGDTETCSPWGREGSGGPYDVYKGLARQGKVKKEGSRHVSVEPAKRRKWSRHKLKYRKFSLIVRKSFFHWTSGQTLGPERLWVLCLLENIQNTSGTILDNLLYVNLLCTESWCRQSPENPSRLTSFVILQFCGLEQSYLDWSDDLFF